MITDPSDERAPPGSSEPSHVVGVGASAGGLEALELLFRHMPEESGLAFVVVQHLSPDFKTQMPELLSRWTSVPVRIAEHEMLVEADTIYVMPPNRDMIVSGGRLLLEQRSEGLPLPIDLFLRSLAADRGDRAIGVILSGTGSDGSRGIREIHDAGGLVIVQTEDSARFDGMPRSAIGTGLADLVLPPEQIPGALARHADAVRGIVAEVLASEAASGVPRDGSMSTVFALLRERFRIDFSAYKPGTIARRTERRIQIVGAAGLPEYVGRLQVDRGELDALYEDLLIGVTGFFRDEAAFGHLETAILPELVANIPRGTEVRVWVAGCATGEEAYTHAILLAEAIARRGEPITAKIFATDVHAPSLEIASAGVYAEQRVSGISRRRLERYFTRVDGGYKISADLRQMIVFAPHNVLRDAPFTKLNLVSCRNMLIYLQPAVQRKVMALFHFALRTHGVLFLGPSESPGEVADEFDTVDPHWKMYRKRRDVRILPQLRASIAQNRDDRATTAATRAGQDPSVHALFSRLLERTLPPSVLVNRRHEVIHTFGDLSRFVKMPRGRPSLQLLDLLEGDVKLAVAGALHRVARSNEPVTYEGVAPSLGARLDLTVTPVTLEAPADTWFLVSLREGEPLPEAPPPREPIDTAHVSLARVEALELELRHTKENLQATIEELEAANEELQATNEELLAANEELQSTNEELHSVNEELYTVNAEFQKKIDELIQMNDDMDHLLLSTEVHTLFLDDALDIRKFTPRMEQVFRLQERDVGRRIDNFVHELDRPDLMDRLAEVRDTRQRFEAEVTSKRGTAYLLRILPYTGRAGGVVVTLTDVTLFKEWQAALEEQITQREQFLATLSHELRNPLAGLTSALGLLRLRAPNDDGVTRPLASAERQARQMGRLLDDLLDVNRITHGKLPLHKHSLDVRKLVEEALDVARAHARHPIELVEPNLPVIVDADPTRMLQIFENLLANAVKYSPDGQAIRVEVAAGPTEVTLTFRDHGAGIRREDLTRIFDLFVQGEGAAGHANGGLGVGLTLVKGLVELHGGTVRADSDGAGTGSTFRVTLPRGHEDPERDPRAADAPLRLVLVEDIADVREPLVELLREKGFDVEAAADGPAGLALVLEVRPDVAILDIGLPTLDGHEVARRVRAQLGRSVRLVALTGFGSEEDRRRAEEAGFDLHLVKPVTPEELVIALRAPA